MFSMLELHLKIAFLRMSQCGIRLCYGTFDCRSHLNSSSAGPSAALNHKFLGNGKALRSRKTKNPDISNGSLACPSPHSLASLIHLLAPDSSLRSPALLLSFIRSLAHSLNSELMEKRFLVHTLILFSSNLLNHKFLGDGKGGNWFLFALKRAFILINSSLNPSASVIFCHS